MSVRRAMPRGMLLCSLCLAIVCAGATAARAQDDDAGDAGDAAEKSIEQGGDRFFADKDEADDAGDDDTLVQGSLVSTSFAYRETGTIAAPLTGGMTGIENASSIDRVFTDLRAQLDARHVKGSAWDLRVDARARVTPDERFGVQTSVFGGNEYQLRELYVKRIGATVDLSFGRQYIPELATRFDGVRADYAASDNWTYIGFAGLYPDRTSRSIGDDYPKAAPAMVGGTPGSRILPVAAGAAGAYRFDSYYGAIGAAAVLPLADEQLGGAPRAEQPRVFVTSNGYWRRSANLDIYHYAVIDLNGANASERDGLSGSLSNVPLTNLSIGANYRPSANLRVHASINRNDTETLTVMAQTRLEDPDPNPAGVVQSNVEVSRISQQQARLGVSAAFAQRRFEVSVNGTIRQRPELRVNQQGAMNMVSTVVLPAAQALEVGINLLDRRSFKGHRISGGVMAIKGFGDTNLYRTDSNILRLGATRSLKDGRAEYELDLSYIASKDDRRGEVCTNEAAPIGPFGTCFGTASISTVSAGGLFLYRPRTAGTKWLVVGNATVASQGITIIDSAAGPTAEVAQPRILIVSALLRVAYRF